MKNEDKIAAAAIGPLQRPGPKGYDRPEEWKVVKRYGLDAVADKSGQPVAHVRGISEVGMAATKRRAALLASAGRLREQLARLVRLVMSQRDPSLRLLEAVADAERVIAESS